MNFSIGLYTTQLPLPRILSHGGHQHSDITFSKACDINSSIIDMYLCQFNTIFGLYIYIYE